MNGIQIFYSLAATEAPWGGGGEVGGLRSRLPKLWFEYLHISFSNIPYPYNFFHRYPISLRIFSSISRIPVTPNGASPQGSAMLFYITIYKLEQKSGERTRYAANCLSSKSFIANLAILYIQIALTFKLAKLKRYPRDTNTN